MKLQDTSLVQSVMRNLVHFMRVQLLVNSHFLHPNSAAILAVQLLEKLNKIDTRLRIVVESEFFLVKLVLSVADIHVQVVANYPLPAELHCGSFISFEIRSPVVDFALSCMSEDAPAWTGSLNVRLLCVRVYANDNANVNSAIALNDNVLTLFDHNWRRILRLMTLELDESVTQSWACRRWRSCVFFVPQHVNEVARREQRNCRKRQRTWCASSALRNRH